MRMPKMVCVLSLRNGCALWHIGINKRKNMNTIEIKSSKPWVKRVTGLHPLYVTDGEWMAGIRRVSSTYHKLDITEDGIYQVPSGKSGETSINSRRVDSGYIRIQDGVATEITRDQAVAAFAADPKNN
jgi:hypothetical protein